ncbi:transcription initiation factor tfiie subunit alpha [Diplodia corticola]|uniref:Transcription initiation factor tfiie subunit alpha n=1 Tax=Diplodia corticola TaxID=236234 RepID=A0A1J9R6N8_9PEZI|nr:transcription initiation factor tfiie subunit alpha [Diplodia corticola]OJD36193.1 transcription initiation factor tfiie subunit alpha [Diplodia corticola]
MEIAKVLVRTVTRIFYDTEQIIVIDALVNHGAISAADLSLVMDEGKNHKKVQKYAAKLREGGLVSVYVRSETREGAQKPTNKEYYYIDYRRAVDCVKYRIHMLDEKIKAISKPTQEKKDYLCPRCNSQWTTMEALDHVDMRRGGFLCKRCDFPLKSRNTEEDAEPEADDTPAKFNKQFKPLLDILQQIDMTTVPAVTGEEAVANAKPVPRDEYINPAQKTEVMVDEKLRPTAVKGLTTGPEKVEITISTEEENTAAEQARVAAHKAKIAASNELPVWATHSTVGGEASGAKANGDAGALADSGNGLEPAEEKSGNSAEIDAYFIALQEEKDRLHEEQGRKALEDARDEEEEEDEDDEFEDVMGTPTATTSGDGAPEAKRVKVDESAAPTPPISSVPAASSAQPSAGEESDADEFEDAL